MVTGEDKEDRINHIQDVLDVLNVQYERLPPVW